MISGVQKCIFEMTSLGDSHNQINLWDTELDYF